MNRRFLLLATVAAALPTVVLAQGNGRRTMSLDLPQSSGLTPFPVPRAAQPRGSAEIAPMPNRNIEPPRDIFARPDAPTLEPMIIDEREQRRGFTFGREHLSDRQDVLLKDLAPGARLRIPLE
ncbi:hypothetical protein ACVFYP_21255 [Roseomonas sp. F4]